MKLFEMIDINGARMGDNVTGGEAPDQ